MRQADVRRLNYGYFVRPASETGNEFARVEPALGYAAVHETGIVLFDTGIAEADVETDAHYRPYRRPTFDVLGSAGLSPDRVVAIVNSHLHFDHCGGNREFPHIPSVAQSVELANARSPDYTIPSAIDFDGATYQEVDGEAEILRGIWVIPSPGHTSGHQSLVLQCADGTLVCAGQSRDFAYEYGSDLLAKEVRNTMVDDLAPAPRWIDRLEAFDPRRILFAHDLSVLEP